MLKAALGSYDQFPYEINVPVEATHEVTLSEVLSTFRKMDSKDLMHPH